MNETSYGTLEHAAVDHSHDGTFASWDDDGAGFHMDTMHGMGNAGAYALEDLETFHDEAHGTN